MARFKVGDKVKLVQIHNPLEGQEQHLHKIGIIVDVDEDWSYPYEVDFDKDNLYCDAELEPVIEEPTVSVGKEELEITKELMELRKRIVKFSQSEINTREIAMVLTKIDEARLWAKEFNSIYGHRHGNLK